MMRRLVLGLSTLALSLGIAESAGAQYIRNIGGVPLPPGDDNSTPVFYGFDVNYYGVTADAGIVCTNGYLILGLFSPGGPCAFPGTLSASPPASPNVLNLRSFYGQVMAPYFSDINTELAGSGPLVIGTGIADDGRLAWGATWDNVRGYAGPGNLTFQLALLNNGGGNFTMEFNYGEVDWNAEGGIGYADDGGETGTPVIVNLGNRMQWSRYSCDFVNGSPINCATLVPEPSTVLLVGTALVGLFGVGYRQRRRGGATLV